MPPSISLRRRVDAPKPHAQGGRRCRQPVPRSVFTHPSPTSRGAGSAGSQCRWRRVHAPKPHEQGAWVLRFGSVPAVVRIHGGRPKSRGRPPAAVGNGRRRRWRCIHAPKPRAKGGRRCRQPVPLARIHAPKPHEQGGRQCRQPVPLARIHAPKPHAQGGRQCRQPVPLARIHAPKPHEQGAWVLRCVPNGAMVRVDGGRPTSRGLPPAGRQCRRPVPLAPCSRTQAPRAGGPAVPAASAVGAVFTHPSPTSRGLGCFVSVLFRQ